MPFVTRVRVPRRAQPALRLQSGDHQWSICYPDPDDPIVIAGFGEAAMLATAVLDLEVHREVLVLLDPRRHVTALLLDPPAEVGLLVGMAAPPGVEAPPTEQDRRGYHALRRAHMAQGLLLLDVILTNGDTVRSLAIGCDPDPVWFDEFDPLPQHDVAEHDPVIDPAA